MSANRRTLLKLSAGAAAMSSLSACLSPAQQRQDTLLRLSREFNNDVRWGRYDTALAHFEASEGARFLERVELVGEDLVIADHEMTSIKFEDSGTKARTVAVFEWYSQREPVIRKTSVAQDWTFEEGAWRLTKQVRLRGPRFPLVTEPVKPLEPDGTASNEEGAAPSGAAPSQPTEDR